MYTEIDHYHEDIIVLKHLGTEIKNIQNFQIVRDIFGSTWENSIYF